MFTRFFYDSVFSVFTEKELKIRKQIDEEKKTLNVQIKNSLLKIDEKTAQIDSLKVLLKEYSSEIHKCAIAKKNFLKDLNTKHIAEGNEIMINVLNSKISDSDKSISNNNSKLNDTKKQINLIYGEIASINQQIKELQDKIELVFNEKMYDSNLHLFPFEVIKEARRKLYFVRDTKKLYKEPAIKKARNKKENFNFSRVWFVKFNKFVLITMFSYFFKKVDV